ncbi:MAG: leucyl aminopeptidase [Geminicoccaceae bacterium]|nr:leucyl aminopeptidase [Geminicoccaceae bacterium]MCS7267109.1 leucyl aminopeptidase [Geminicoccaceae bacterium]MCX7630029.1 leucyl aminopeptidase [Geminicoccaceae bacterium]MDW8124979.1 leucyl aminopeptidase [Geminicoccaceae bacterium]MDW8341719.1 leucyl aminopeptidase [Geminicoccaceae bacterium]
MRITVTSEPLPETGTVVVPVGRDGALSVAARTLDESARGLLRRALAAAGGPLEHGQAIELLLPAGLPQERLVLLVLGKPEGTRRLDLEEAGGRLAAKLGSAKASRASLASTAGLELGCSPSEAAIALATGCRLRAWRFTKYQHEKPEEPQPRLEELALHLGSEEAEAARSLLVREEAVIGGVLRARELVSEPANVLGPAEFAQACRQLERFGVAVEVLDKERLEALGMRALLGVAQGSARPPFVVVMRWRGAEQERPLAFVGKGVCFDTGGISLKPAQGMEEMKFDMAGAAAVFGTIQALAARKARVDAVGVIGLVENMPSGTAQRPGDVVRAMSGKTIEVVNTDAEGRLVLADCCWYTQERFKPAAMIDLATLTGACIVALGRERAGLFASDDTLAQRLLAAGEATGELLWRLPLGKAYEQHIKSEVADIKNVGRNREAGAIAGAVFIQQFTGGIPWAHLDIAGTAWTNRDTALAAKGATGFGVRLLDRLVRESYEAPAEER